MRVYVRLALLLGLVAVLLLAGGETAAAPGVTRRVSVDSVAGEGDGPSEYPAISADGRYVAFHSSATDLVPFDTNGRDDVFVHDRMTGATERVSLSSAGSEGNSDSLHPAISDDGRYVAFDSNASNLVSGDTNGRVDIFVRDRQTNTTERVSLSSSEAQGNDTSWYPAISGDGRYVAFQSFATNLVSGDTNGVEDVFVRDRQAGTTSRVSVSSGGVQGNNGSWDAAISSNGRYVAFGSDATNLVTGDTNGYADVFVRDRQISTTTRVSVSSAGLQGTGDSWSPAINADGRYVAFFSFAPNLVTGDGNGYPDIFVRDRQSGTTVRVNLSSAGTQGNGGSFAPAISDGRFVAFQSQASNLVAGDANNVCDTDGDDMYDDNCPDVFLRDRDIDEDGVFDEAGAVLTTRVSVDSYGGEGDAESLDPSISGDGSQVAFSSFASNLVTGDTNGYQDVFLHDSQGWVGGIAELPHVSGPSARNYVPLAGLAAAVVAVLSAGAWLARRRSRSPGRRP